VQGCSSRDGASAWVEHQPIISEFNSTESVKAGVNLNLAVDVAGGIVPYKKQAIKCSNPLCTSLFGRAPGHTSLDPGTVFKRPDMRVHTAPCAPGCTRELTRRLHQPCEHGHTRRRVYPAVTSREHGAVCHDVAAPCIHDAAVHGCTGWYLCYSGGLFVAVDVLSAHLMCRLHLEHTHCWLTQATQLDQGMHSTLQR
jgi:hypothetical protein